MTNPLRYIEFGSKASLDDDLLVWVDLDTTKLPSHDLLKLCKEYEAQLDYPDPNISLGHWTKKEFIWNQKGSDLAEINNSILDTWKSGDIVEWKRMDRNPILKIDYATRVSLGMLARCEIERNNLITLLREVVPFYDSRQLSLIFTGNTGSKRTNTIRNNLVKRLKMESVDDIVESLVDLVGTHIFRALIRVTLRTESTELCLNLLSRIDLTQLKWFGTITGTTLNSDLGQFDRLKKLAFQIGQTLALLDGIELYDKDLIADRYPSLRNFAHRRSGNLDELNSLKNQFVERINSYTNQS